MAFTALSVAGALFDPCAEGAQGREEGPSHPIWPPDESKAGWTLVEKFDNSRVRLKRSVAARTGDAALDFDPYRTWTGMSDAKFGLTIVGIVLGVMALAGLIAFLATR